MINIERITIREHILVDNEKERLDIKSKIAEVLGINPCHIEMRFEDQSRKFNGFNVING